MNKTIIYFTSVLFTIFRCILFSLSIMKWTEESAIQFIGSYRNKILWDTKNEIIKTK